MFNYVRSCSPEIFGMRYTHRLRIPVISFDLIVRCESVTLYILAVDAASQHYMDNYHSVRI